MSKLPLRGSVGAARPAARGAQKPRARRAPVVNPFLVAAGLVRAPAGTPGRVFKQPMNPDDEVPA
ncbi:hypothetical protein [Burkholderia glumae]|uniref:Uncharacterized protein n=1 Tax=Burkholderia glumae TaxID=337 RepID=A0ABY5BCB8_BURGL|nr:hypothetical protein [Burkholderia glumae]KHJ64708.1 hypothetical protein NCPPB3923_01675 [Burkholderia glumae]USS44671.1 hypothetical protein NFI99_23885 [Burkholderia glumae]